MSEENQISVSEETFRKMLRDSINFCENSNEPHIKEATAALQAFEAVQNPLAKPWRLMPHNELWHVRDKNGILIAEGNKAQMSVMAHAPTMLAVLEDLLESWKNERNLVEIMDNHVPRIIRKARGEE